MKRNRALLFDADPGTLLAMRCELEGADFSVTTTGDAEEAWSIFIVHQPDVVVVKLSPSQPLAIKLIRRIRGEAASWVPVIVTAAERGSEVLDAAFAAGQEAATQLLHLPRDLGRIALAATDATQLDVHNLRERRRRRLYHDLRRALLECNGVISHVAEQMGEDRATIYYHLKKFGLY